MDRPRSIALVDGSHSFSNSCAIVQVSGNGKPSVTDLADRHNPVRIYNLQCARARAGCAISGATSGVLALFIVGYINAINSRVFERS